MHYLTISFTHKNSTLAIRERLAYNEDHELDGCLTKLLLDPSINEGILISTCNRMEIITSCNNVENASRHIFETLSMRSDISVQELRRRADQLDDYSAIHHLFTVASSLDSMVVGETQIAGQLKDAFRFALHNGFCGQKLTRAINYAFKCAAEIRNVTDISSKPVSIASVAVAKAKEVAGSLDGKKALVIGSGEMSVITSKNLKNNNAEVTIMNRTRSKAEAIAEELDLKVEDFERLHDVLDDFDLLFTATGSKQPIIKEKDAKYSLEKKYWFDMAVPRDIEEFEHGSIELYYVDDLKSIVDNNIMLREDEARASYVIIGRYVKEFFECLKSLSVEPLIKELYLRAFRAAEAESSRAVKKGFIPAEYSAEAKKMCEQAMKRFLHDKAKRMRNMKTDDRIDDLLGSLELILGIDESYSVDTEDIQQQRKEG